MEQEKKMCDWCGMDHHRRYTWWRLLLAILIGLFIFLAGIEIGQMRGEVTGGIYRGQMMRWRNDATTIVIPPTNNTVSAPAQQ